MCLRCIHFGKILFIIDANLCAWNLNRRDKKIEKWIEKIGIHFIRPEFKRLCCTISWTTKCILERFYLMLFFFHTTLFQNKLLDAANPSSILINEKSYSLATDLNIQPSFFGTDTHAATLLDVNGNKQAFYMYWVLMAPVDRVSNRPKSKPSWIIQSS